MEMKNQNNEKYNCTSSKVLEVIDKWLDFEICYLTNEFIVEQLE